MDIGTPLGMTRPSNTSVTAAPLIAPGLLFWFDARVITGLSNDDSMVTWIDTSGKGNTAILGTAPVYRTADLNSGPAVQGNGTSQHMLSGVAPSVATGTMIAVFNASASSDLIMGSMDGDGGAERCYLATSSDGNAGGGVGGSCYNVIEGTSSVTDGNPHVLIVTYDGSNVALYVDGMLQHTQSQSGAPGSRDMVLLAYDTGAIEQHFAGDVGQLLYYNNVISDRKIREISLYFAGIYGITTGLVKDYRPTHKWGEMINMAPASDYITGARSVIDYGSNPVNGDLYTAVDPYSTDAPSGVSGGSTIFDGVDDYVFLGNEVYKSDIPSGEMTMSAWFNADSFSVGYSSVLKKGGGGSIAFALEVASGSIRAWIVTDAGSELTTKSVTMSTGTWYHLLLVADGSNMNIYLDGVAGEANAYDESINYGNNRQMSIGDNWETGGPFFHGKLKDIKLWQRGITAAEITALVAENTSSDDYPDDPDNWWKLDSDSTVDLGAGKAISFDGTDDHIVIPYGVEFGTGDWAVSFWARPVDGTNSREYMFSMQNDTAGTNRWGIRKNGDIHSGVLGDYIIDSDDGTIPVITDQWSHITVNHNGNLQVWQNGVKRGEAADTTNFNFSSNYVTLGFSGNGTESTHYFTGDLDDVKVWTRSLSEAEISALAVENQGSTDYPTDPDNHWSFDHGVQ